MFGQNFVMPKTTVERPHIYTTLIDTESLDVCPSVSTLIFLLKVRSHL